MLNLNVPAVEEIKGIKVVRHSSGRYVDRYRERKDPRGQSYYWLDGDEMLEDGALESDDRVLAEGYASLTPLQLDLTDYAFLEELRGQVETSSFV